MINEDQLGSFKEVIAIGAKDSTVALSKLTHLEVTADEPTLQIITLEEVPEVIGQKDVVKKVVLVKLSQGVEGVVLFLFDPQTAHSLVGTMNGDHALADSTLNEVVNIVLGSGLTAVADFLHLQIMPTAPTMAEDMLAAVIDPVIAELGASSENVLLIKTGYATADWKLQTYFLTDPKSSEMVLQKIMNNSGAEKYGSRD